ncbi:IS630 family transposase domain protein [Candidatus Bealeia paramacronuclearis]|uniref:IS630 family transposase domain protein n=1 Tax=Candidatus Bealeia paramacronuclearis TaxID=1921001 RepID=A0ABZ2C334_9PROT|nr:IS630 family transposase domain protein [Candidatus Bealeia paramacronuclearis]
MKPLIARPWKSILPPCERNIPRPQKFPYTISKETKQTAEDYEIVLHYLPPYSPNLNPIERLWKVMNECVRNNRVFKSTAEFRKALDEFFAKWSKIASSRIDCINDNFQILNKAPSS